MSERRMPSVDDYPSNSNREPREKRRKEDVKPVVRGRVRKKSSIFKTVGNYIEDDMPTIGDSILNELIIPSVLDLLADICHGAIDGIFKSDGRGYYRRNRGRDSYISYNRMYDDRRRSRRDREEERYEERRRNRDIYYEFDYKEDADDVLDRMCDYLERFPDVPVSYFFDLIGETIPGCFTDDDWGWTDLSGVKVRRHGRKWYIDFPRIDQI